MTKAELRIHNVDRLDRGLAYGEACFETFRVIDGGVLALERHLNRFAVGAAAFGIALSEGDLDAIGEAALAAAADCGDDVLVRVTVTGGEAPWGLALKAPPELYIQCMPFQAKSSSIELVTVEWPFPLMPKIAKFTSDYALSLRAMQQWDLPPGSTPLICRDGRILSTPTANVLLLHEGRWLTPGEGHDGVLPGVVRSLLIDNGLVEAADCAVTLLEECEAVLLANSGSFVQTATSLNGRKLDRHHTAIAAVHELLKMYPGVKF